MSWYKITLEIHKAHLDVTVRDLFMHLLISNPNLDAAIFSSTLGQNGLDLYFTPSAAQIGEVIVKAYAGTPCLKPSRDGLGLLIGDQVQAFKQISD